MACIRLIYYSQTLLKRSSLPPKPPEAEGLLLLAAGAGTAELTGAALLQPPKSSSAVTFGGFGWKDVLPNPLVAEELFPQPLSVGVVTIGAVFVGANVEVGLGAGIEVEEVSGVPQTSLPPKGSDITALGVDLSWDVLEEVVCGFDKLKTDV